MMVVEARNHTKIRVLLYLKDVVDQAVSEHLGGAFSWRAPATIANHTDVNVASLYTILKRWRNNKWGYADARYFTADQMEDGRPHWLYRINAKGIAYLNRLHKLYKAEKEVKIALSEYQIDTDCDFIPWNLHIRCIAWHIKPSEWTTVITWPFESAADVKYAKWFMKGYEATNLEEAVHMVRSIFNISPKKECIDRAMQVQNHFIQDALNKLAAGAGFVTTKEA